MNVFFMCACVRVSFVLHMSENKDLSIYQKWIKEALLLEQCIAFTFIILPFGSSF